MSYNMHILDQESRGIFDVSTLLHDVQYYTSLQGQPGKLTFTLEKDPNGLLQLSMGSLVKFWNDGIQVFYGYVFTIDTDKDERLKVTAYDQMRYLQNHDYIFMSNMNLTELFKKICTQTELKYRIMGHAKEVDEVKLDPHHFNDVSYFDMLQYAITRTNANNVEKDFEKNINKMGVGASVYFAGGKNYVTPRSAIPTSYNRTAGVAKITQISNEGLHKYHIIGTTSNVYGWVDEADISPIDKSNLLSENFYFIRDNFGVLELNDITSNVKCHRVRKEDLNKNWSGSENYKFDETGMNVSDEEIEPLIIGDESLLMDYNYSLDIDKNTYNEVFLIQSSKAKDKNGKQKDVKKVVLAKQRPEMIQKWGILRKITNIKGQPTKQELEQYIELSLDVGANVNKTLRLDCLGYNGVYAGDGFYLQINKLGIHQMVYVISATHNYDGNKHTMSLEVSTSRNLVEVLG